MNENNAVVEYRIVPNDTRDYVKQSLEAIWNTKGRNIITRALYTDNPRVDNNVVKATFTKLHPGKNIDVLQVHFLQILSNFVGYLACSGKSS